MMTRMGVPCARVSSIVGGTMECEPAELIRESGGFAAGGAGGGQFRCLSTGSGDCEAAWEEDATVWAKAAPEHAKAINPAQNKQSETRRIIVRRRGRKEDKAIVHGPKSIGLLNCKHDMKR